MIRPIFTPTRLRLKLFLSALFGKTDVSGNVAAWQDKSAFNNNASQSNASQRPTDNTTYLTFNAANSQNMDCGNDSSLNLNSIFTLYSEMRTSGTTNYMGLIDKYTGSGPASGYTLFLDQLKRASIVADCTKFSISLNGTTAANDGNIHKIHGTVVCTRKFCHKQYLFHGAEPQIFKEGGSYYCFYGEYNGSGFDIHVRKSISPYFDDAADTNTLVISGYQYCSIMKAGSTYRVVVTDSANHNLILYSSTTIDSGYTMQGTLLTYGNLYDAHEVADPCEIIIGGIYFLYYSGFNAPSVATVCYATSTNGNAGSYSKLGTTLGNGGSTEFDYTVAADPDIILLPNNTYIIFYSGYNVNITKQQQGYATSSDGINWTKFSGNPIHYFTDPSWEEGIYGPNEPSCILETDIVGNKIWRMYYRGRNDSDPNFKIGYTQWYADANFLPISGNETVVTKIYLDNVLENTDTRTGYLGIDYVRSSPQNVLIGGDGASTLYFTGDIFEIKIFDKEITSF